MQSMNMQKSNEKYSLWHIIERNSRGSCFMRHARSTDRHGPIDRQTDRQTETQRQTDILVIDVINVFYVFNVFFTFSHVFLF